MIALDTNILVYAHRRDAPFHAAASALVRQLAEGNERWAIPWPCIHEFLANVTHARIYKQPTPLVRATEQIAHWLAAPTVTCLGESEQYWDVLSNLLAS